MNIERQTGFCCTHIDCIAVEAYISNSYLLFLADFQMCQHPATIAALKINITTILTLFSVVYNDFCLQDKLFYQVLVTKNMYIW